MESISNFLGSFLYSYFLRNEKRTQEMIIKHNTGREFCFRRYRRCTKIPNIAPTISPPTRKRYHTFHLPQEKDTVGFQSIAKVVSLLAVCSVVSLTSKNNLHDYNIPTPTRNPIVSSLGEYSLEQLHSFSLLLL